ncbi:MAG: hypothetical protein IKO01_09335 [Kiritimatiellae bacterium]|nr:hypothetical protein [Kiritimatiellia bacterium]
MTTWTEQRRAATRERLAFAGWWAGLSLACGAGLVGFVWARWPTLGLFAAVALGGAWLGPILAWASLRAPRRNETPWPAPGAGADAWRHQANALGRMLLYHQDDPALPKNVRKELVQAHRDLRRVLRAKPSAEDLERECARLWDGPVRLAKRTAWLAVWPAVKDLETAWREGRATHAGGTRHHLLHELVGAAAATASEGVLPRLLARERWECVEQATDYALQLAGVPGWTPVSPIALAAVLAIEWSDFAIPFDPEPARARLAAILAAEAPEATAPAPAIPVQPAEEVPPPPPKHYRRVRVRVRHEGHHHRSLLRRLFGEPLESVRRGCFSFVQWLRYALRSWMLYR